MKSVVTFVAFAVLQCIYGMTLEEAYATIKSTVRQKQVGKTLCQSYSCCNITATEACSVTSMSRDQTTLVLPGGETRCIYSDSGPFAFQVIPGDSDKLVVYFQGGGACWDKASTTAGLCTSTSSPQSASGIFDRKNERNSFTAHTIVHVLYCSGDIFGGNIVRDYKDKKGVPVEQKGIANTESAIKWLKNQQSSGNLAATLSSIVVMGASAGAIGAEVWGNEILKAMKWKSAAIVPDSYAGVFPEGTQGPLMESYGMCTASFLTPSQISSCLAKTLTLQEIEADFMNAVPSVPYAFIQSKTDSVQIGFYTAIGATFSNTSATITPAEFYDDINEIFGTYNKEHPNFLGYLVDGSQHVFTNSNYFYTADAKGPQDSGKTNEKTLLAEWVNTFPLAVSAEGESVCEGSLQLRTGAAADTTFCSSTVVPKTYRQV